MNDVIKTILPWLTTALTGPLGGMAAGFIADKLGVSDKNVETIKTILNNMSPEDALKLKDSEQAFQLKAIELGFKDTEALAELETRNLESVNKTMQAEAAAEHWPTYSWRPYNGFLFGTTIFCTYFLLPMLKLPVPVIPESVWLTWGAILGIASYYRGKTQSKNAAVGTLG
jgi:hypothetical protein